MKKLLLIPVIALMSFTVRLNKTALVTAGTFAYEMFKAQQFAFGSNVSDTTAGIWEANSPTSFHPNRRYQIIVHKTKINLRGKRIIMDSLGQRNVAISNAKFMWIDQSTGEIKVSKLDTLLKYLDQNIIIPLSQVTGTIAQFNPIQGASTSTTGTYPNITFNNTAPDQVVALTGSNGLTTGGTYPNFTITQKKKEYFSGSTDASGNYTVVFGVAYSVAPNISVSLKGTTNEQGYNGVTVNTTGFTVHVYQRTYVLGLAQTPTNVSGATIDLIITEK